MTAAQPRFKYSLGALETLYAHRLEQTRLLLVSAQRKVDEQQRLIGHMQLELARAHDDWIEVSGQSMRFDPARFAAVREALAVRQAALAAAVESRQELQAQVELCREHVALAHRRVETVARHKEYSLREFAQESARVEQRLADASWPLKGHRP
ncbi:hypothetical protein ACNPPY_08400 [Achromobacter sp. AGC78]